MGEQFINIKFPFADDDKGKFLEMNQDAKKAIKSDLMHLLLTNRGERFYLPEFGTNLRKYIFEQNDSVSHTLIKNELQSTIKKFIPNLTITELKVERLDSEDYTARVTLNYTVTVNAFESNDFLIIQL